MGGKRIKPVSVPRSSGFINSSKNDAVLENKNCEINFSFRYMKDSDGEFHINHDDAGYFQTILKRLHDLSSHSFMSLTTNRSPALRFHRIKWDQDSVTRESFDIPGEDDLYDEAYQFSVSSNEHGRIMGFFTDQRTFNIVWLDKDHRLYS